MSPGRRGGCRLGHGGCGAEPWRAPGYPELVVDPLVARYLLEGFDPTGLRWVPWDVD